MARSSVPVRLSENERPAPMERGDLVVSRISEGDFETLMNFLSEKERKALRYEARDTAAAKATKLLQNRGMQFVNGIPVTREVEDMNIQAQSYSVHTVSAGRQVTKDMLLADLDVVMDMHRGSADQKLHREIDGLLSAIDQGPENVPGHVADTIRRRLQKLTDKTTDKKSMKREMVA